MNVPLGLFVGLVASAKTSVNTIFNKLTDLDVLDEEVTLTVDLITVLYDIIDFEPEESVRKFYQNELERLLVEVTLNETIEIAKEAGVADHELRAFIKESMS